MDWKKCLWSLLVPWHNDWLCIWLYLGFGVYFAVETCLIMARDHSEYKFAKESNYNYMFIATLGITISLFTTAAFLILYPISENVRKIMDGFDYMGKLVMIFLYSFAFFGSELQGTKLYFPFEFLVTTILIANLIMTQYETGRVVSFWISIGILLIVYIYDFFFNSTPKEKRVFYVPMFVELIIIGAFYLMYIFQIPERWCRKARFIQLYITGFTLFTLMLINFVFEAHNILYYTIKLNAGNFDDYDDDWWRIDNMFHRD